LREGQGAQVFRPGRTRRQWDDTVTLGTILDALKPSNDHQASGLAAFLDDTHLHGEVLDVLDQLG